MVGETLAEIRARVEALASDDGEFHVACARTGERPVPAAGERFPSREAAREAARATERYRAALRRYDPRVPHRDPIVRQEAAGRIDADERSENRRGTDWSLGDPVLADSNAGPGTDRLTEFCHAVAAAAFEALSDAGHDGVESAVLDAYFDLAERVVDPDDLCLRLLECLATTVDDRLSPDEQAALLDAAAPRLGPVGPAVTPLSATFARLSRLGLVGAYDRPRSPAARDGPAVVEVSGYALSPRDGRLPVFPVALELYRRRRDRRPTRIRADAIDGGWRIAVATDGDPVGLASAPVRSVE